MPSFSIFKYLSNNCAALYCWLNLRSVFLVLKYCILLPIGKSKNLWIIMEYCPNGNLRNFVRSSRRFYDVNEETLIPEPWRTMGPKTLMYFAFQISKGMTFLISRKVSFDPAMNLARRGRRLILTILGK